MYHIALIILCILPIMVYGQAEPTKFEVITDLGGIFQIYPADGAPTTDVVSTPYVEFQRIGGLVINNGIVRPAAQYNDVSSGPTYVIDNWGDGRTYGIPNGAPLEGEFHLSPIPHLNTRAISTSPIFPDGIKSIEIMSGNIISTNETIPTYGKLYKFTGTGRAIIWLDEVNPWYVINMVCPGCYTDTPAIIGNIPVSGGKPQSHTLGTSYISAIKSSGPCIISGVNHIGCGEIYRYITDSSWPLNPRPVITAYNIENKPRIPFDVVLNITSYDDISCPGANKTNTKMHKLNDTLFQMISQGCIMENYRYQWWDNIIQLHDSLPLRAGLNIWDNTGGRPAIILNIYHDTITLQAYATPSKHTAEGVFQDYLNVRPGNVLKPDSLAILYDSFTHLGAYNTSNIQDIDNYIRGYTQILPEPGPIPVVHSAGAGPGEFGGFAGKKCHEQYEYCISVFDKDDLPVIYNAGGIIYDPRNGAEMNRGSDVTNHANVFTTGLPGVVPYDGTRLNIIQAYAVIPVTGAIKVEELYIMHGGGGGRSCDIFIDKSTTRHIWSAPATSGWLRLNYLEKEYGGEYTDINVPMLQGHDVICMRTFGNNEFRQFKIENFFRQGDSASFGGTKHHEILYNSQGAHNPIYHDTILYTDVILPGGGVRVMDLDIDMEMSVVISSYVKDGGGATASTPSVYNRMRMCDWPDTWHESYTSRLAHSPSNPPMVRADVTVNVQVPTIKGYETVTYAKYGTADLTRNHGIGPTTLGSDCVEQLAISFGFPPEYHTIPIQYTSNDPITIIVSSKLEFFRADIPQYANSLPIETIYIETYIERLSVRVH